MQTTVSSMRETLTYWSKSSGCPPKQAGPVADDMQEAERNCSLGFKNRRRDFTAVFQ